jgi:hypothetical protein
VKQVIFHRFSRRPRDREGGQAALEFMLILPIFVMFLLVMVDLGIMTYHYVSVSNSVREAARFGAVNCGGGGCTPELVAQRAVDRSGGILPDTSSVSVHWEDVTGDGVTPGRGDAVVVKVNYRYDFLFFPLINVNVHSCSNMRLEQQDRGTGLPIDTGGC